MLAGIVQGFQSRQEPHLYGHQVLWTVWIFNIVGGRDAAGNQQSVQVEMRGLWFEGAINDSDQLEVETQPGQHHGQLIRVLRVYNRTAGCWIVAHTTHPNAARPARERNIAPGEIVTGTVQGFQARQENEIGSAESSPRVWIVWSFRLEEYKQALIDQILQVEMRGLSLEGAIHDGDRVEVTVARQQDGVIHALKVRNVTSQASVTAHDAHSLEWLGVICMVIIAIMVLVAITSMRP